MFTAEKWRVFRHVFDHSLFFQKKEHQTLIEQNAATSRLRVIKMEKNALSSGRFIALLQMTGPPSLCILPCIWRREGIALHATVPPPQLVFE
jgi:hypothetical protein